MIKDEILSTDLARELFETVARQLPIIDFHNHLSVRDLAENRGHYEPWELWIGCDPYKHRAMRILGVAEAQITGDADAREKFRTWCAVFPHLIANPLDFWSRLELERVFGITMPICAANADAIYEAMAEKLATPAYTARGLLSRFGVRYCAPCMGFCDDLSVVCQTDGGFAPSLRGDDLIKNPMAVVDFLDGAYGRKIESLSDFRSLFSLRLDAFHTAGCRLADHALDAAFPYLPPDGNEETRFAAMLAGADYDKARLACDLLRLAAELYHEKDWILQLHLGALRSTSDRLRQLAGPVGGFAAIGMVDPAAISLFLHDLENRDALPRTVLYAMAAELYPQYAVLGGSYNRAGEPGLVTLGASWWWADHFDGMKAALDGIADYGVLSTFPGMTTDSRSLLSFSRHEAFRRYLCAWLGEKAKRGEITSDFAMLSQLVSQLSYGNAAEILRKRGIENV